MLLGGATLARPLTARAQLAEKVSRIGVLAYESLFGAEHLITAYARGALAVGLQRAGQLEQARQEFRRAIPTIISARSGGGEDDALLVAAREQEALPITSDEKRALPITRRRKR